MPYIKQERRERFKNDAAKLGKEAENEGDLNYTITVLLNSYLISKPKVGYAELNAVIGMLECCKLEYYRRIVAPYEDTKITENGEV